MPATRLQYALDQIVFARRYVKELLAEIDPAAWYQQPTGCATHVAWQVGHLATAQYHLALVRITGPAPEWEQLMPPDFVKLFGRTSTPSPGSGLPTPEELLGTLDRVHNAALQLLPNVPDVTLNEPLDRPHRYCKTKYDCVVWCSQHEMLHAGQIGLLRRLQGSGPVW